MGVSVSSGRGPQGDINVTPLVDVVLVLLIIFMVVTPALQMGLDVEIPPKVEVEATVDPPQEEQLVVRVSSDAFFLNRDRLPSLEALRDALSPVLSARESEERVVFFDAADEIAFARAVAAIDIARAAGATRIGFLTEPISDPPES